MQNQDSVEINGPIAFPLIARIVSFRGRYWHLTQKKKFRSFDFVSLHFLHLFIPKTVKLITFNSTLRIQDLLSTFSLLQSISPPTPFKLQILLPQTNIPLVQKNLINVTNHTLPLRIVLLLFEIVRFYLNLHLL